MPPRAIRPASWPIPGDRAATIEATFYHTLVSGQRRGLASALVRAGLWSACLPYGLAVALRNAAYDRGVMGTHHAAVPVVSVGNLTLGGTGKTPCVEAIVRHYRGLGLAPCILSRGYGSTGPDGNDEARVLAANLPDVPHLQGADRLALADRAVLEHGSDVLVLDDGFQHRRLHRDLDIVLIDATRPWGHGHLFPRGLLRERTAGLGRAHLAVLTRCDLIADDELRRLRDRIRDLAGPLPVVETVHRPMDWVDAEGTRHDLASTAGQTVAAFCGIGNPESFHQALMAQGLTVRAFRGYADHHAYGAADLGDLDRWAADQAVDLVATTQKDLVKLPRMALGGRPLRALRVALAITAGEDRWHHALSQAVRPDPG